MPVLEDHLVSPSGEIAKSSRIATVIAEEIRGAMRPGDLLEPERVLAKRFDVSRPIIREALGDLEWHGMVRRHQGRGTVVMDQIATGEIAIVVQPHIILGNTESSSYRLACGAIAERLGQMQKQWIVKMHIGKAQDPEILSQTNPHTLDLLEPHVLPRLRGVFSFHPLHELQSKLDSVKVPVVHLHNGEDSPSVALDSEDFLQQSVDHLYESGCRKVGLFWFRYERMDQDSWHNYGRIVSALASQRGMACCEASMQPRMLPRDQSITEQDGYDLFQRLWHQPTRPEGLIISDDVFCKGALRAILQLGLKLPRDLKLITYANRGMPLPYHEPVTRIEFDIEKQIELAVEMMDSLVRGEVLPQPQILLRGKLVKGQTTS